MSSTEPVSVASTWGSFPRLPAHPLVCPAGSALPIFRQGQFQQVHPCAEALLCARRIARTLRPIPKPLHAAVVCCAGIPASRYTPPLQWALMPCCALTCSGRRSSTARLYPPSTNGNPLKGPFSLGGIDNGLQGATGGKPPETCFVCLRRQAQTFALSHARREDASHFGAGFQSPRKHRHEIEADDPRALAAYCSATSHDAAASHASALWNCCMLTLSTGPPDSRMTRMIEFKALLR